MSRRLLLPGLVLGVALLVRLASWNDVFSPRGVAFPTDSDPHYHALRVERWLAGEPGAPWRDPSLDWPRGAQIPWPPLFDALLAASAKLAGAGHDREGIATTAALLPVLLGLLLLPLVAALGREALGERKGWIAAFLVAGTSVGADHSRLGRADQHALELLLFAALLLATLRAHRGERRAAVTATLALLVAAAFWAWMGSPLHLLLLLAIAAGLHLADGEPGGIAERTLSVLAGGLLGGSALLAATAALLAPEGALTHASTTGVGLLQVAVTAGGGLSAALLLAARRRFPASTPGARVAQLAAPLLPPLLLFAFPALRAGILGGLVALGAANSWYATIGEFEPLLGAGEGLPTELLGLTRAFGLVLVVAPFGLPALVRALRRADHRRAAIVSVLVTLALLVPLSLARRRFSGYAILPLAICAEAGIRALVAWLRDRVPRIAQRVPSAGLLVVASIATAAPSVPEHLLPSLALVEKEELLLRWMGTLPRLQGREGVLAPWSLGHVIQYYAGRPVVTSPFGTEGGPAAMPDAAAFWFAPDEAAAESVLERRRCGLVLLGLVPPETYTLHGFAPAETERPLELVKSLWSGGRLDDTDAFWRLIPIQLYFGDGNSTPERPPLSAFRLLAETPNTSPHPALETQWKLFEPVEGARVRVRGPGGAAVRATVRVETNAGRLFEWSTVTAAGGELRLPYASGANGAVIASEWTFSDGSRSLPAVVHEEEVREGARFEVDLALGTIVRLAAGQADSGGASDPASAPSSLSRARTTPSSSSSKSTR